MPTNIQVCELSVLCKVNLCSHLFYKSNDSRARGACEKLPGPIMKIRFVLMRNKSSSQKGLVSTDRSKMTALLSTTPRRKPKSSTNDFAPMHSMGWVSCGLTVSTVVGSSGPYPAALPPRAPKSVGPRISLPPNAQALIVSLHFRTGF